MLNDEQLDDLYDSKTSKPRTVDNFIKGLQILKPLMPRDSHILQGEHDIIYVFAGAPTSDEQQIELDQLGFRYDEENDSWEYNT